MAVAGHFINTETARIQLIAQIDAATGLQTAEFIQSLLTNSTQTATSPIASIIGGVVLLAGASGIFYQIQYALNRIWNVPKKPVRSLFKTAKDQTLAYLMVLLIGLLFMVILILSTLLSVLIGNVNGFTQNVLLLEALNFLVLFVTITVLVAVVYRVIPDKEITWTDVWLGAAVTALLFMLGKYAIGIYLSVSKSGSAYGAAGSLIVLLTWIYYSTQIFLLGAEFTHTYSLKFGSHPTHVEIGPSKIVEVPTQEKLPHEG